ncbi:MAG TPA: HAMP domain-containing protein, partial [Thermoanaerobaculia bacterium]|nr:HAMP domain-containing protein [Thermoanaerobaculia bacterium]
MALRKSTRVWIVVLVAALAAAIVIDRAAPESGCWSLIAWGLAAQAAFILLWRAGAAAFRLIVRRLTLRLAFSYFLIGIVPIPLLAALLFLGCYVVANQFIANRLRREITAVGESGLRSDARLPAVAVGPDGKVISSDLEWLPVGALAPWDDDRLERPGFLVDGDEVWLAVPVEKARKVRLLHLNGQGSPWLQQLADRTGYETGIEVGTSRQEGSNITIDDKPQPSGVRVGKRKLPNRDESVTAQPRRAPPSGKGMWSGQWVHAFYLETALNAVEEKAKEGRNVAVLTAVTSPQIVVRQLFEQGVDEIGGAFRIAFLVISAIVLFVYAVALTIAFVLVGSITRNVNRLTRATEAAARGDFSVRVQSKSRDQIGDLARSFDGMADSIQRLLLDTARKER